MAEAMSAEDLEKARAWAEETDQPYPIKRGFLTLLDEVDRLRAIEARVREMCQVALLPALRDGEVDMLHPVDVLAELDGENA